MLTTITAHSDAGWCLTAAPEINNNNVDRFVRQVGWLGDKPLVFIPPWRSKNVACGSELYLKNTDMVSRDRWRIFRHDGAQLYKESFTDGLSENAN